MTGALSPLFFVFSRSRPFRLLSPVTVGALTLTSDTAREAVDLERIRFVVVLDEAGRCNESMSSERRSLNDKAGELRESERDDENTPPPLICSSDSLPALCILEL